jgi:hypothetical protein
MTDLRDRARDEAEIRQRLNDLAATITTDTTWDQLQILVATSEPPHTPRRKLAPNRVRIAAAAAAIVLAAAAVVVARRGDDGRVNTADTTTTSTTSTTRPGETATTTTLPGSTPPGPPISPNGAEPVLPPGGLGSAVGSQPTPTVRSSPAPTTSPTTARPAAATSVGALPVGASPDGYPVALSYGGEGFNPTITSHQEGGNTIVDVWNNQGAAGVQHLDTLVVPPRGNQNCLIFGSTSAPFVNAFGYQRIIGGVVTTRAAEIHVYGSGFGVAYISPDPVAPGLHAVLALLDDETFFASADDNIGFSLHTVTDSDRDAFPDTC